MESRPPVPRLVRFGRWLRLTIGFAGLLSLVAFVALWVLSYRGLNYAKGDLSNNYRMSALSLRGQVILRIIDSKDYFRVFPVEPSGWQVGILQLDASEATRPLRPPFDPFDLRLEPPKYFSIAAPHWFLVALSALTVTLAAKPPVRFTIRWLLVVLTVAAALLGAIVAASR